MVSTSLLPRTSSKNYGKGGKIDGQAKIARSVIGFVLKLIVINDKVKCEYCVGIRLC